MIGRRHFAAMLGALAAPSIASAQPGQKRRLAYVHPVILQSGVMAARTPWARAFFAELNRLGYSEDRNLVVESWSAQGDPSRYEALAQDVLAGSPDAVLVWTSRLSLAFRKAGGTVPVVFLASDALGWGIVDNMARPGGNLTGVTAEDLHALHVKAVEFLHEAVPNAKTIALLVRRSLWDSLYENSFRAPARRRGLMPVGMLLNDPIGPEEYRRVFSEVGVRGVDLLVTEAASPFRSLVVELAAQYQLPACYILHDVTYFGEMMAYGPDPSDHPRVVAGYVARVLNGEKPADMPVLMPDKYKLLLNLKAAKALGLTFPPAILARADEVIE